MLRVPAFRDTVAVAVPGMLALGIAWPEAADAAMPLLPWLVALLVFAAVMAADAHRFAAVAREPATLVGAALFMQVLLPAAAALAGTLAGAEPALVLAATLLLASPVGTSAHLYVAMAGGNPSIGLCLSALTLVAIPVVLPLVPMLLPLSGLAVSPLALAQRAALVVLLPAAVALALRCWLPRRGARTALPAQASPLWAWVGLSALLPIALARTTGLGALLLDTPLRALELTLMVAGLLFAAYGLSALAFARSAVTDARGIAVAAVSRNISVAWAATAGLLPAGAEQMLALSALVFYGMPPLLRMLPRLGAPTAAPATA